MIDDAPEVLFCRVCDAPLVLTPSRYVTCPVGHEKLHPSSYGMTAIRLLRAQRKAKALKLPEAHRGLTRTGKLAPWYTIDGKDGRFRRNRRHNTPGIMARVGAWPESFRTAYKLRAQRPKSCANRTC